jgi:general L-amino acid transport system permease protein
MSNAGETRPDAWRSDTTFDIRHSTFHVLISWCRRNLFSSPLNAALTLLSLWLIYALLMPAIQWLIVDAQWRGVTPADCPDRSAACWPFVRARWQQFLFGLYPESERWRIPLGIGLAAVAALPLFFGDFRFRLAVMAALFLLYAAIGNVLLVGGRFGLTYVDTGNWGGFFLTIVTAVFVLATSLPIAVLLALGRESTLPMLRLCCAAWVEFWRSVPALVVLFVAIIMFPLFMPPGMEIDKLLRALLALTLLMSCYLSEALRGALQAIPRGQYEAADALGMGYWQRTFLVILPQAIPTALPQITSNFIGLFKETTVLLIIGLYDLLGMVQSAASDPQWLSPGVSATGYVFAGLFYWLLCLGLSRYSARLERRVARYRAAPDGHAP